jgi:uncharacterized protein (DUF433 family)
MAATILSISEIVSDPKIRGGRPVIAGTGLTVMNIVLAHTTGDKLSPEQIAEQYRLTLGQVYAALAYYHLHQTEIDDEIRTDITDAERLQEELRKQGRLLE